MSQTRSGYPPKLIEATELVTDGKLGQAEKLLRAFVHDNPSDVNGIRMLGEVAMSLGALKDAQHLFERSVELAPITPQRASALPTRCINAIVTTKLSDNWIRC